MDFCGSFSEEAAFLLCPSYRKLSEHQNSEITVCLRPHLPHRNSGEQMETPPASHHVWIKNGKQRKRNVEAHGKPSVHLSSPSYLSCFSCSESYFLLNAETGSPNLLFLFSCPLVYFWCVRVQSQSLFVVFTHGFP